MLTQYYLYVRSWISEQLERQEGQDLAEYAIMVGIIAVAVITVVLAIGGQVTGIFQNFSDNVLGAVGS